VTTPDYIEDVKEALLTDPFVVSLRIARERATTTDGHIRARLTLLDSSQLEFSEYVQRQPDGSMRIVTYSYNRTRASGELIRRWDNTPHYPQLAGYPHHIHDGSADRVLPGEPVNVFEVLDLVSGRGADNDFGV
jgi:hypothetical protein